MYEDLLTACKKLFLNMPYNENVSESLDINGVTLSCHIYKYDELNVQNASDIQNIFNLCTQNDCATQILLCNKLNINNNITFKPPYRCKGMIIYCAQDFVNDGIVSMTQRGCMADGQNIYLYQDEYVPAVGGAGAAAVYGSSGNPNTWVWGGNGSSGTGRQTGGGGGGIAGGSWSWGTLWYWTGRGGNGTSYSGGTGAGQWCRHSSSYSGPMLDPNGSNNGGAGGHGSLNWDIDWGGWGNPGGVGNPPGRHTWWIGNKFVREIADRNQNIGTGGLLVIFSKNLINNNNISSDGTASKHDGAGSSGGGSINLFYAKNLTKGRLTAIGGQGGRYGGNGTININQVPTRFFSIVELDNKRNNSDIYKNIHENVIDMNILDILKGE
jgi:hypothetical protein